MLMSIPFTTCVILVSCVAIMAAPGQLQNSVSTLFKRQTTLTANQNGGMKSMGSSGAGANTQQRLTSSNNNGSPSSNMEMSDLEKEAKEASEEKKPGLNTIASAIKELYFHDKYGSQKHDTPALVKLVGQVAAANSKTCDPDVVAKAIVALYEPYNNNSQGGTGKGTTSGTATTISNKSATEDATYSLNSLAHSFHETWEKQITAPTAKVDNAQLLPAVCQAIAASSASGDPAVVAKAVEAAYAKLATN